jgi:hypothetical protein
MKKPIPGFVYALLFTFSFAILFFQFRNEIKFLRFENKKLTKDYEEVKADRELTQFAWATSSCNYEDANIGKLLPQEISGGAIAVRLTDLQCSSCIDYLLFQLRKYSDKEILSQLLVLFSAENESLIKLPFRLRLLNQACFVNIPIETELTPLDQLNIPYLLSINGEGYIQSTYLPYNASDENIDIYLRHASLKLKTQNEI